MTEHDDKLDAELESALQADLSAWTPPEPPAGFADRVVEARVRELQEGGATQRPRRRRLGSAALIAGAAAIVAILVTTDGGEPALVSGATEAMDRESIAIGHRGVAVAEAGASLSWSVNRRGGARVEQARGNVFYRVNPSGAFEVATPVGSAIVTGTCFRVEVNDMSASLKQLGLGAAVGAALTLSVYEGKVLFADASGHRTEVVAGDTLAITAAGEVVSSTSAGADTEVMPPPKRDASRDELLLRDEVQRAEIASLRKRVRELERPGRRVVRHGPGASEDDGPWFAPTAEQLQQFAADCRVRYDVPPMDLEGMRLSPEDGQEAGMSNDELARANRALALMHKRFAGELTQLYIEATGDANGADSLSPMAMASELRDKGGRGEMSRIQQAIARERAGLKPPPADLSALGPLERYYRLLASVGDDTEKLIGAEIGAERARELRERKGGWGMRMEVAGCPQDGEHSEDVER